MATKNTIITIFFPVVAVSVPSMESVSEEDGTVEVCSTLTVSGGSTANDIQVTLATRNFSLLGMWNLTSFTLSNIPYVIGLNA